MCGIAGYLGNIKLSREDLAVVAKTLYHRGPDDYGVYVKKCRNKFINLVHTRLKIIDLDNRSNQPFKFGNSVLVFNGEIYNYIEIKNELISLGHIFRTSSDTEVLIHALREWGVEKSLQKFEGMWAFAWFDEIVQKLYIARDRFGEKPLFISESKEGFYFSSEIKGISSLQKRWPEKNLNHLMRYLNQGYKSLYKKKETFFKDVFEFPKGFFAVYDLNGNCKKKSYWKINFEKKNKYSFKENSNNVKELLIESLKLRTRSDVPIAFCLSGGIDSNVLIHLSKKKLNLNVHGFSINSKDKRYSEKDIISKSIEGEDIDCSYVETSNKNFLNQLKNLIIKHDSPVSTISYYAHFMLLKKMKSNGYTVSMSGTGADELFTGYYDHHNFYLAYAKSKKELFFRSLKNWNKFQKKYIRNKNLLDPKIFIENPTFRDHIFQNQNIFKKYFKIKFEEKFSEKKFLRNILKNRMLNELFYESVPVILHEDDHNAMSLSMENRSPFLDKKLFEYSLSIPTEQFIQNGFGKSILRESVKGIVPNTILNQRKKIGFNLSILEVLKSEKRYKEKLLDNSTIFNFISKREIELLLKKKRYTNSESKFLFNFKNINFFLESFKN